MKTFGKYLAEATDYYFKKNNVLFDKLSMDELNKIHNALKAKKDEIDKLANEQNIITNKLRDGIEEKEFWKILKPHENNGFGERYKKILASINKIDTLKLFDNKISGVVDAYGDPYDYIKVSNDYRRDYNSWKLFFAKCYGKKMEQKDIIALKEKICDIYDTYFKLPRIYDFGFNFFIKNSYDLNVGDSFDKILNNRDFFIDDAKNVENSQVFVSRTNNKSWEFLYSKIIGTFGKVNLRMVWICSVDLKTGKITSMKKMIGYDFDRGYWYDRACEIAHVKKQKYVRFTKLTPTNMKYPSVNLKTGKEVEYDFKGRHPNDPHYMEDDHGYLPGNPYYNPTGRPMVYD